MTSCFPGTLPNLSVVADRPGRPVVPKAPSDGCSRPGRAYVSDSACTSDTGGWLPFHPTPDNKRADVCQSGRTRSKAQAHRCGLQQLPRQEVQSKYALPPVSHIMLTSSASDTRV